MICSIISGCAALLAVILSIYFALVPGTRGWAGLDDFMLRAGIIGVLALISLIGASIGLYLGEPYKIYLIVMVVLSALPAIAAIMFFGMIIIKLL